MIKIIFFASSIYNFLSNKFYFKLLYLFTSLSVSTTLLFAPGIRFLNKIVIFWGLLLIAINLYELFQKKRKPYSFEIVLYAFLALTLALTFISYPTVENIKTWLINTMLFTVIFSIDVFKPKPSLKKELTIISYLFVCLTFILSIISINMILLVRKIWITDSYTGKAITYGFDSLFSNPNSLGIASVLSLVIGLYLFLNTKSTTLKIFNVINFIVQIQTLILSTCRSAYLMILALLFVYMYVYIKNNYIRFSIIFITLSSFAIIVTFYLSKLDLILSGREAYWRGAFTLIKNKPLFGVGNSNLIPMIKDFKPSFAEALDLGGLHNIYIEIATVNGLVALLLIILFIILVFFFLVKNLDNCSTTEKSKYTTLLALFIGISLINLFESTLVYRVSFINLLFWIYSGYLISIFHKNKVSSSFTTKNFINKIR